MENVASKSSSNDKSLTLGTSNLEVTKPDDARLLDSAKVACAVPDDQEVQGCTVVTPEGIYLTVEGAGEVCRCCC